MNNNTNEIDDKNKLLRALDEITELSLSDFDVRTDDMHKIIYTVLKIMGGASARADRSYIWENYRPENSYLLFMRQTYEWVRGDEIEAVQDSDKIENVAYDPQFYEAGAARKILNAIVGEYFDDYMRGILQSQDIKSILIAPIYVDDYWWGFIGFDDCHSEKLWTDYEANILMETATVIAKIVKKFGVVK